MGIELGQERPPQRQEHPTDFPLPQPSPARARTAISWGQFAPRGASPEDPQDPFEAPSSIGGRSSARWPPGGSGQMGTNLVPLGIGEVAPRHGFSFRRARAWRGFYTKEAVLK